MTLSEELAWRGFVNQTTFADITEIDKEPITFYWGVDPSAKSMHIGQLAMSMMIRHFIMHGHKPILLIGGATGLIGDPDGKDEERELKSEEEIASNKASIVNQYKQLFNGNNILIVDNYDWFKDIGFLQFLRDVGKHVPMSQMLGREFVQTRLGEDGTGISYAEFSYALIQGYDFVHLYREYGATLQVCGSDQWGNSIAGVELLRRIEGVESHIWSAPLIINKSTGKKFGKTEEGAVWLDADMTSPYKFYQFWLNVDDEGVEDYLKIYTLLNREQIDSVLHRFATNKSERFAQKNLAYETTKIVHGEDRANSVQRISEVLFSRRDYKELKSEDFDELAKEIGRIDCNADTPLADALVMCGLAQSKGDARRFIDSGAIYCNGVQHANETNVTVGAAVKPIHGNIILRRGKNTQTIVFIKD